MAVLADNFLKYYRLGSPVYWSGVEVGKLFRLPGGQRVFLKRVKTQHFYRNHDSWCLSVSVLEQLMGQADAIVLYYQEKNRLLVAEMELFLLESRRVHSYDVKDPQVGLKSKHWSVICEP